MQQSRRTKAHRDKMLEAMLSVATYRAHLPRFINWLGDRQITEESVGDYVAELKLDGSPARSRVVWRAAVKRGLREAAMRGLMDPDHLERWLRELDLNPETQAPRVVQTEVQWITPEEYYQVVEACQGDRQRLYMEFLWTTGSRVSEMAAIRPADCTPSDMNVVIHLQAKSHKQREVRMGVTHNFTPFLDTRPGVPDDQRFKALAGTTDTGGLFAYASGDGIHWQLLQETPVIPPPSRENATQWWEYYAFDSQNVAFWSGHEGIYVCYYRTWKTPFGCQRMVTRSTSEDFLHWTPGVPMLPVFPGEHLYTNGTHPYFRARHIYIALPTQLLPERNNSTQILFMSSRGGDRFDRTFREAFIRPGLQQKKWGDRANYAAWHVVPTGPREMSIYVRERRYVLRTDGFVSVHADYQPGELLTRPIVFSGTKLDINYSTSASGDLRFEVQDAAGHPVPGLALEDCPPIFGDEISRLVAWTSGTDLSSVAGKPVRLRVVLRDADLYAIRFVNGDEG